MTAEPQEKAKTYRKTIKAPPKGMALLVPKQDCKWETKGGLTLHVPEVTYVMEAHTEDLDQGVYAWVIEDQHWNLEPGTKLLIASSTAGAILDDRDGLGIEPGDEIWTLPLKMHNAPKNHKTHMFSQVWAVIE